MHWLIPFAAPGSEAGRQALRGLALPQLAALMADAAPAEGPAGPAGRGAIDAADELSFSPPHERALARALGLPGGDGTLPWAAWQAARDGIAPGDHAWGLLTPAHWHLGTDQVTMRDPEELALDEAGSRALLDAVHDLFADEGFVLVWGAPLRWYLAHPSLAGLRTASLDRVIGRNVDPWLPPGREARLLRRLQNEVQMRLHGHPLNEAREAAGLLPVNSVWLSGCGPAAGEAGADASIGASNDAGASASGHATATVQVDDRLRRPALAEDWATWATAWQALDAGPIAALRQAWRAAPADTALTLCGERAAVTLRPAAASAWRRLTARWRRADPAALLETL